MHFFQIFWSFCSFHLVYLLKALMKLDCRKSLDEMEQKNSGKNRKVLVLLMTNGLTACRHLILEQIL